MTQVPRGRPPETSFLQLSAMCPQVWSIQPGLLQHRWPPALLNSEGPGAVRLSLGLQKWSQDAGPLDLAPPEPFQGLTVFSPVL